MFSIFFKSTGVVYVSYSDKDKTIGQYSYHNDRMKPLVTALNKQRPTIGSKNIKFHYDKAKPDVAKSIYFKLAEKLINCLILGTIYHRNHLIYKKS